MLRLLFAAAVLLAPHQTMATPACAFGDAGWFSHDVIGRQLARDHGEVPVNQGLTTDGDLLQLFAATKGSSWTVVLTRPDGMSCLVAGGTYWQDIKTPAAGPEA